MRALSVTLGLWTGLAAFVALAAPKFPVVTEIQGHVRWQDKDKKEQKLKPKQVLIEQAGLETDKASQVVVQIDAHRVLRVLPESRVEFPSISWESGDAPIVVLKRGSLRWKEEGGKGYNIALQSELFQFISPVGDVVLSYDPVKALAEVRVVAGSMEFSAMNAEESALVAAGQKVQFQGVRENDEIVYDVLLKGKRIPRGKLGLVQPFSAEEKVLYSEARVKKEAATRLKKKVAEKKAQEKERELNEICTEPAAKLNQCAWVCQNNPKKEKKICRLESPEVRCVRTRCNANGEWAEATEISKERAASLCGVRPVVKECDY